MVNNNLLAKRSEMRLTCIGTTPQLVLNNTVAVVRLTLCLIEGFNTCTKVLDLRDRGALLAENRRRVQAFCYDLMRRCALGPDAQGVRKMQQELSEVERIWSRCCPGEAAPECLTQARTMLARSTEAVSCTAASNEDFARRGEAATLQAQKKAERAAAFVAMIEQPPKPSAELQSRCFAAESFQAVTPDLLHRAAEEGARLAAQPRPRSYSVPTSRSALRLLKRQGAEP